MLGQVHVGCSRMTTKIVTTPPLSLFHCSKQIVTVLNQFWHSPHTLPKQAYCTRYIVRRNRKLNKSYLLSIIEKTDRSSFIWFVHELTLYWFSIFFKVIFEHLGESPSINLPKYVRFLIFFRKKIYWLNCYLFLAYFLLKNISE